MSSTVFLKPLRSSSVQSRPWIFGGTYCTNTLIQCLPAGVIVGSVIDGNQQVEVRLLRPGAVLPVVVGAFDLRQRIEEVHVAEAQRVVLAQRREFRAGRRARCSTCPRSRES